jgi:protein TonB
MSLATWPISLVLHGAGLSLLLIVPLLRADAPPPLATPSTHPPPLLVVPGPPSGGGDGMPSKPPPRSTERKVETPPATDTLVAPITTPDRVEEFADLLPEAPPCPDCLNLPGEWSPTGTGGWGPSPLGGSGSGVGPLTRPEPDPVRAHTDVRPPERVRDVTPVYPEMARQARLEGIVIIECTIDVMGRVSNATVLRDIPFLSEAALEAVQQWRYKPTLLNGVPVPVIMTVTVNFQLG